MKKAIRLRGISGPVKGKVWTSDHLLRAGRLATLEIVLDDSSVSRKHAEVRLANESEWMVKDLESTNGTYVNGHRVPAGGEKPLRPRDVVQFGKVAMMVEMNDVTLEGPPSDQLVVAAKIAVNEPHNSPNRPFFDRENMPRAGDQLFALLRAGHHLVHLQSEDALLDSILHDAVNVLDSQRGAIVLAEGTGADPKLRLRSLALGTREPSSRFAFSKRLAMKAFATGESILFKNLAEDEEFKSTQSIADGSMGSVLCVMLRTPRKKLGVLHLDRSVFQPAFTEFDLTLADALAAHVSAGIECAHLLRNQKESFQKTIMMLASAVEMRDEYTGGHTQRVTKYATMLAEKLELPDDQIELIRTGTPLHDIGKIGIPDAILRKEGRLTAQEYAIMQTHATLGAEYLAATPDLAAIIPIVRNHHERWDGTGYPDRLTGEETPLLARIVAVCDCFDAMTSDRPYHENKRAKPPEVAFEEVKRQAGRQFDPKVAGAFLDIRDQILRVLCEYLPGQDTPLPHDDGPPTFDSAEHLRLDTLSDHKSFGNDTDPEDAYDAENADSFSDSQFEEVKV
ncbi:hypothetical protein BH11PLA2_BH11PLA2_20210 [soil metagenome]